MMHFFKDELTAINVKQGFNSSPQIPDEVSF